MTSPIPIRWLSRLTLLLVAWCGLTGTITSRAQVSVPLGEIIYDNSAGDKPDFFPSLQEYGDEINLKAPPPGASWILTDLYVECFGDFTPEGDEKGRLRIYNNDGPGRYASPGTILYDSGEFPIEMGFQTRVFSGLGFAIPTDLTWTIQFSGLRGVQGDQAGLLLRPTPTVGHSFKDFWIKNANGWTLSQILPANPNLPADPVTNPDPIENFGCRLIGITDAPPPKLNFRRDGENLVIEWSGGARLQSSDFVAGGFSDVAGASSPYTTKFATGTAKFWRLITGGTAPPPTPTLAYRRADQNLVLEWTGAARLQSSETAVGGFGDVAGATSPYNVPLGSTPIKFWRLAN
jgi:hypothetical protein